MSLKYNFILILFILLTGCVNTPSAKKKQPSAPAWYLNLSEHQYEIIGYGSGDSREEARTVARSDIAKSLIVHIKSEFKVDVEATEETLNRNVESHISEYTNIVLTDAKVIQSTQIDVTFYVALSYENLPLGQKIKKAFTGMTLPKMKQNSLYQKAYFSITLKSLFGYLPEYDLFFKNGLYYLHMQDKLFALKDNELRLFFFEKQSQKVSIEASSKQLKPNDFFHFYLNSGDIIPISS